MTSHRLSILLLVIGFAVVTILTAVTISAAARTSRYYALMRTPGDVVETRTIELQKPHLSVSTSVGDIIITGTQRSDARVTTIRRAYGVDTAKAAEAAKALTYTVESRPDGLFIQFVEKQDVRPPAFRWPGSYSRRSPQVSFLVEVPAGTDAMLVTSAGDLKVSDTVADVDASSSVGDVELQAVAGTVKINNSFGDIRVASSRLASLTTSVRSGDVDLDALEVSGKVEVESDFGELKVDGVSANEQAFRARSGDISLRSVRGILAVNGQFGEISVVGAEAEGLHLESQNGDITFEGTLAGDGDNVVGTQFGDISLMVPVSQTLDVDLSTQFGDIDSSMAVLVTSTRSQNAERRPEPSGRSLVGSIGGGGPNLKAHTQNGDIRLGRAVTR